MVILLYFSNKLISEGIRCILEDEKDIEIRIADDAESLSDVLQNENPDLLFVNYHVLENYLPPVSDKTKVLLLDTGCSEQQINYALIIKNVYGIIDRNTDKELLKKAFVKVNDGTLWVKKSIIKNLISRLSYFVNLWSLNAAEKEVFRMISIGFDDSTIARKLGKKEKKVKLLIESLKQKSKVDTRWELIDLSRQFEEFDKMTL
ncbi:MAG: hypothetical protein OEW04_11930 [Nitrospirota bacterium]|nr:hypothetical protein [Nitrospirota bacterium]